MKHRSPAYWPTRILLVVGIAAVAAIGLGLLAPIIPEGFSDPRPAVILGPLEIPAAVFISVVWFVLPVVGLIWMVRVFRGPREDEPPPWRHRDR
jgi:hypothetical protein